MGAAGLAINLGETGGNFIMGLLAAHDKRVAEAKAENSAVSAALAALVHDCQLIAAGFSDGSISASAAVQACIDVDAWYWQYINPYTQYKNASPAQCQPNQFGDSPKLATAPVANKRCWQSTQATSKTFTAASFMGCNIVDANLGALRAAILALNGKPVGTSTTIGFCGWPTNQYGLTPQQSFKLTLTVPKRVVPEEVTLSSRGVLSVGSSPSTSDVVVSQGLVTSSIPDTGQITLGSGVSGGLIAGLGISNSMLLLIAGAILAVALLVRK